MIRENSIIIIIIILILIGNFWIQRKTDIAIDTINKELTNLKEKIISNKENIQILLKKVEEINKVWEEKYKKLAYIIEHDELEKVETNLTNLKSYIEVGDYEESLSKVDTSIFLLEHIKEKAKFKLVNIF